MTVATTDKSREPRHPRRLLKKKNMSARTPGS